jgi:cyclic pyranopterin phosphate synthase
MSLAIVDDAAADDAAPVAVDAGWDACRTLTCSVLPVRVACNCDCRFCFSKSSLSSLASEKHNLGDLDVDAYYAFARARGATRLVITGGGEPLLRPAGVVDLVARGRACFDEIAVFTNGRRLSRALAVALRDAGASYLCWSRHHDDDAVNRDLMGEDAPDAAAVIAAAAGLLPLRLTCVMARGFIDSRASTFRLLRHFADRGIEQFTFKHTYVAWPGSLFSGSDHDRWAHDHAVNDDPFVDDDGPVVVQLPWGPRVRDIALQGRSGPKTVRAAWYFEPDPRWEKEHRLCRSLNLLSDGSVFASLEDTSSLLLRLRS